MADKYYPKEDDECIAFAQWLRLKKIPFAHIANESRSSSRNAMIRGAKLKQMGQARGVWDYEIFIPQKDKYKIIKIEMKRQKGAGSSISKEQKEWGEVYSKADIPNKICYGFEDAKSFVESML